MQGVLFDATAPPLPYKFYCLSAGWPLKLDPRARKSLGDPSNMRWVIPILGAPDGAPVSLKASFWGQVMGQAESLTDQQLFPPA